MRPALMPIPARWETYFTIALDVALMESRLSPHSIRTQINNQTTRYIGLITKNDGNVYKKFEFMPPKDPGDGTVPLCAAVIHSSNLKSQIGLSIDHEGAYKKFGDVIDSRLFSLRSIIKIAYEVKKTSLAYV
jgi:hypothetical protein